MYLFHFLSLGTIYIAELHVSATISAYGWLGYQCQWLGQQDTKRINTICVTPPEVARAGVAAVSVACSLLVHFRLMNEHHWSSLPLNQPLHQ
jgi:hypothetical protein